MTPMSIADCIIRNRQYIDALGNRFEAKLLVVNTKTAKRVRADSIANDIWRGVKDLKANGVLSFDRKMPARLPFDNLWVEWKCDPDAQDIALGSPEVGELRITDSAVRLWNVEFEDLPQDFKRAIPSNAEHAVGFAVFIKRTAGYSPNVQLVVAGTVYVDADYRHISKGTIVRMPFGYPGGERANALFNEAVRYWVTPALYAVGLMNCRNIALAPVAPVRLSKKAKPEKIPRLDFHTIRLPAASYASGSTHASNDPTERAHHLVRGHFKTYTPEAPLMGKVTGTYWWGWQARGAKKNGIVTSDYQVKVGNDV